MTSCGVKLSRGLFCGLCLCVQIPLLCSVVRLCCFQRCFGVYIAFHHESSSMSHFWNHATIVFIHFARFVGSMIPWFSPSTCTNAVGVPSSLSAVYICIDSPIGTLVSAVPCVKSSGFFIFCALKSGDLSTYRSFLVQG